MTQDHIDLLLHIKESANPNWVYISNNYPIGKVWDHQKVAELVHELTEANLLNDYEHHNDPITLTENGQKSLEIYFKQRAATNEGLRLEQEKLTLEVHKLRDELFDYPNTKKKAKWALIWACVAAVAAVLSLIWPRK